MAAAALLQDRSVYEQLCKDYLNLKTIACGSCLSPDVVRRCKEVLRDEVNSARKFGRMRGGLEELLDLLEARNALSMIKVELLARLEPVVKDREFEERLARFQALLGRSFTSVRRYYLEELRHRDRRTLLEKELEQVKLAEPNENPKSEVPRKLEEIKLVNPEDDSSAYHACRQDIFDLLTKEISRDWNALGRNLQLDSASLYAIEERHPKDVRARVQAVLEQAEGEHGVPGFVRVLGEALVSSRRKDLRRKLDKMLS